MIRRTARWTVSRLPRWANGTAWTSGPATMCEAGSDQVVAIGSKKHSFGMDKAVCRAASLVAFWLICPIWRQSRETKIWKSRWPRTENRFDPAVDSTQVAERLEWMYWIRYERILVEAVVQISHEQARLLDQGLFVHLRKGCNAMLVATTASSHHGIHWIKSSAVCPRKDKKNHLA